MLKIWSFLGEKESHPGMAFRVGIAQVAIEITIVGAIT